MRKEFGINVIGVLLAEENENDGSATYTLDGIDVAMGGYYIEVDMYEGKHTTIKMKTSDGKAWANYEGSSFTSALDMMKESKIAEAKKLLRENGFYVFKKAKKLNESTIGKTVKIGDQVWMAENLAIDDGGEGISYNEKNGEYFYTWDAAMRVAKSIPGWHLPSTVEWNKAALACDAVKNKWGDYNDAQGLLDKLDVERTGCCTEGIYHDVESDSYFWSSTGMGTNVSLAYIFRHWRTPMDLIHNSYHNSFGFSIRLVKD